MMSVSLPMISIVALVILVAFLVTVASTAMDRCKDRYMDAAVTRMALWCLFFSLVFQHFVPRSETDTINLQVLRNLVFNLEISDINQAIHWIFVVSVVLIFGLWLRERLTDHHNEENDDLRPPQPA